MASKSKLKIDPPSDDRLPLKVNVFEFMRTANCALVPFFPYLDEGSIVPCGTLFDGGPGTFYGAFEHHNDVDEVFMCFAANSSRFRAGSVRVGQRRHFVGNPFKEDDAPDAYALMVITQRQSVGEKQTEQVIFRCTNCRAELLNHEFDATPPKRGKQREKLGTPSPFATLLDGHLTYVEYNEKHRVCPECGHENPPFPYERWGTDEYVSRTKKVMAARDMFLSNGAEMA